MNIVVRTAGGLYMVRPDTTLERNNNDLYLPQFVDCLTYSPVLFARICKPGRSISRKFAGRYYDGIGYGALLYPENLIDDSPWAMACACCINHTSFIPFPLYSKITLGRACNEFVLNADGHELFRYGSGTAAMVEEAIEGSSDRIFLRSGDVVAIELQERSPLFTREQGSMEIRATYCDNETLNFKIIA